MKNPGIYILTSPDSKTYVGKAINLQKRVREHLSLKTPNCKAIHRAIKKYGAENMHVETIHYPGISHEALCEVEKHKIIQLGSHKSKGGYNLTWGGDGLDSETASEHSRKCIEKGTHHFAGEQGSKFARENNLKRLAADTHHFLNPAVARKSHYIKRMNNKARRRELYRYYAVLLYSRSVDGMHIYQKRQREGFFDTDIPDTSRAEQTEIGFSS